jgi:outer membrane lipopolysaccharide assembly protein LptE/RlpB
MKRNCVLLSCLLFLLTSCGYHFNDQSSHLGQTISIPYVEGDPTGDLTNYLIHEITSSGDFTYAPNEGNVILKVKIIDFSDENIGFRYDRNREGEIISSIVPSETRLKIIAEIALIEACSGQLIIGPSQVYATIDADFDINVQGDGVFSLGQLTDQAAALETAARPLFHLLAQRIFDYISTYW